MIGDLHELLPLYALGLLDAVEARAVERAVASDPQLAASLAALQDASTVLIAPVAPSPDVKARLLASVGGGRFEHFSSRMASLFDVTVERARELLASTERNAAWEPQIPGIDFVHFTGGPACATADCGFVRLARGAMFPPHTHMGEEVTVILSGSVRDVDTGVVRGAGDESIQAIGSSHSFVCVGDEDCYYATRSINGIQIAGVPVRPIKQP